MPVRMPIGANQFSGATRRAAATSSTNASSNGEASQMKRCRVLRRLSPCIHLKRRCHETQRAQSFPPTRPAISAAPATSHLLLRITNPPPNLCGSGLYVPFWSRASRLLLACRYRVRSALIAVVGASIRRAGAGMSGICCLTAAAGHWGGGLVTGLLAWLVRLRSAFVAAIGPPIGRTGVGMGRIRRLTAAGLVVRRRRTERGD